MGILDHMRVARWMHRNIKLYINPETDEVDLTLLAISAHKQFEGDETEITEESFAPYYELAGFAALEVRK